MKTELTYTIQIYVGLRKAYSNHVININLLRKLCKQFVDDFGDCVTITPTEFIYTGGQEPGAIIGIINYPRFPRANDDVRERAFILAKILLSELEQKRISIVTPEQTYMLESEVMEG